LLKEGMRRMGGEEVVAAAAPPSPLQPDPTRPADAAPPVRRWLPLGVLRPSISAPPAAGTALSPLTSLRVRCNSPAGPHAGREAAVHNQPAGPRAQHQVRLRHPDARPGGLGESLWACARWPGGAQRLGAGRPAASPGGCPGGPKRRAKLPARCPVHQPRSPPAGRPRPYRAGSAPRSRLSPRLPAAFPHRRRLIALPPADPVISDHPGRRHPRRRAGGLQPQARLVRPLWRAQGRRHGRARRQGGRGRVLEDPPAAPAQRGDRPPFSLGGHRSAAGRGFLGGYPGWWGESRAALAPAVAWRLHLH
jgi:hypothetical protein